MAKVKDTPQQRGGGRRKLVRGALIGAMGCCVLTLALYAIQTNDPAYQAQVVTRQAVAALETARFTPPPSATITNTPLPSLTPAPSATPTPRPLTEIVGEIVDGIVLGSYQVNAASENFGDPLLALQFEMPQGFEGYNIRQSEREMAQIVCALRDGGFADYTMQLAAMIELVDALGNTSSDEGMLVRITPARSAQMNCENALLIDMSVAADEYRLHRLLEG